MLEHFCSLHNEWAWCPLDFNILNIKKSAIANGWSNNLQSIVKMRRTNLWPVVGCTWSSGVFPVKIVFWIKHTNGSKEHYLLGQNTSYKCLGYSPLSSYKTTLKQELNGKKTKLKWSAKTLTCFGWAMLFSHSVQSNSTYVESLHICSTL